MTRSRYSASQIGTLTQIKIESTQLIQKLGEARFKEFWKSEFGIEQLKQIDPGRIYELARRTKQLLRSADYLQGGTVIPMPRDRLRKSYGSL